jgi:adenine-specific DNA-methyltransferase
MTNILDGLLGRVDDPSLRAALQVEVDRMRSTKDFGLVFEKHMPENVRLYSHPVRRGLRVEERSGDSDSTWLVRRVRDGNATLIDAEGQESVRPVEQLVVIRRFGEPIYPGLKSVGRIERGGDKPFHTVINGENYHALETLLYAYEGKVDCIYIDPPYNTGAKDWKYNNDYVAADDAYRHSKWLSFMERRLELAKRLLNPEDSVLIVTIDEKEYLRIGMLLEQMFLSSGIQMVSSVINPKGSPRRGEFSRADEYIFFVFVGEAAVGQSTEDMLHTDQEERTEVRWAGLRRNGANGRRTARPNLFYPIFFNEVDGSWHSAGEPLPINSNRSAVTPPPGTIAVFPLGDQGQEMTWGLQAKTLRSNQARGYVRYGKVNVERHQPVGIYYLPSGPIADIESGKICVSGRDESGAVRVEYAFARTLRPMTVWNKASHSAGDHGASLLRSLIPDRRFPFPKSLYAVEDTLRFFVGSKSDALVVDFFAGSGTTAHAVMRLNHQDGGCRRSIVVTNNEVSVDEANELRAKGLDPGDVAWESLGIFEHITKPRIEAAVTGITHVGEPIKGDYKFVDEFPMSEGFEENVEFVELTYLDRNDVSRGKSFEAIAPLLWMKVGSRGAMIAKQKTTFDAPKNARYAVLFDIDVWPKFVDELRGREDLEHVFIVTDSLAMYQQVVAELPVELETTMLYEDYLRNFEINMGGAQ